MTTGNPFDTYTHTANTHSQPLNTSISQKRFHPAMYVYVCVCMDMSVYVI